jgi:hypothetical protein
LHIEEGHDAFHEDWIWLGAEKGVDLNSSYVSVDSALAMYGVLVLVSCAMIVRMAGSVKGMGMNMSLDHC